MEDEAEDRIYRWQITPHPYNSQFDTFVTDDDNIARQAILDLAEDYLWDQCERGQERSITVKHNV